MMRPGLLLPVLQNWACHNCGGCCREHVVGVTAAEKQRIEAQNWTAADGLSESAPLFIPLGNSWRINQQSDGACVFLDPQGLCRIHSKFGEPAKPLACRLYPYAIHPAGHLVTASLRFSCPSVVQNLGPPISTLRSDVESLAAEVVPSSYRSAEAPELRTGLAFDWGRMTRLLAWMERGLSETSVPFPVRLQRVLVWLSLLGRAEEEALSDEYFGDLVRLLYEAASRAVPMTGESPQPPLRLAKLMFRQYLAQLLRHDTPAEAGGSFRLRLRLFAEGLRFTLGRGTIPTLTDANSVRVAFVERAGVQKPEVVPKVAFRMAERALAAWDSGWDELFERYFRVKLQGLHFCGAAFYGYPVLSGFYSLALMVPAVLWTARVRAAAEHRENLLLRDLEAAIATLDHNFGYSAALGLQSSRKRIDQLAAMDQLGSLVAWYSRVA
ncbi:MAG: YkgJ family cysteine cluster protein [Planctomycetota bacterium]